MATVKGTGDAYAPNPYTPGPGHDVDINLGKDGITDNLDVLVADTDWQHTQVRIHDLDGGGWWLQDATADEPSLLELREGGIIADVHVYPTSTFRQKGGSVTGTVTAKFATANTHRVNINFVIEAGSTVTHTFPDGSTDTYTPGPLPATVALKDDDNFEKSRIHNFSGTLTSGEAFSTNVLFENNPEGTMSANYILIYEV